MVHEGCPTGQSVVVGDLTVSGAFTRATLPNAPVGAGYLTIANAGGAADRLVSVTSEISPAIELHTMSVVEGMMRMEHLPDGIEIPGGETVSLAPGGLHIMIIGPNQPFIEGECVAVSLDFEAAGSVAVMLNVGPIGADAAPGHGDHAGH
jgi:copper(I)-binding protein